MLVFCVNRGNSRKVDFKNASRAFEPFDTARQEITNAISNCANTKKCFVYSLWHCNIRANECERACRRLECYRQRLRFGAGLQLATGVDWQPLQKKLYLQPPHRFKPCSRSAFRRSRCLPPPPSLLSSLSTTTRFSACKLRAKRRKASKNCRRVRPAARA